MLAISLWDTKEHADALAAQRASFESLGVRFEPAETFEVTDEV